MFWNNRSPEHPIIWASATWTKFLSHCENFNQKINFKGKTRKARKMFRFSWWRIWPLCVESLSVKSSSFARWLLQFECSVVSNNVPERVWCFPFFYFAKFVCFLIIIFFIFSSIGNANCNTLDHYKHLKKTYIERYIETYIDTNIHIHSYNN